MPSHTPSERRKNVFREVFRNEPSTVKKAGLTGEKRRRMKVAISLSKIRRGKK